MAEMFKVLMAEMVHSDLDSCPRDFISIIYNRLIVRHRVYNNVKANGVTPLPYTLSVSITTHHVAGHAWSDIQRRENVHFRATVERTGLHCVPRQQFR